MKSYKKTFGINFLITFSSVFLSLPIGFLPMLIIFELNGNIKYTFLVFFIQLYLMICLIIVLFTLLFIFFNLIIKLFLKPSITLENEIVKYKIQKNNIKEINLNDIEYLTFYSGVASKSSSSPHELVFHEENGNTFQIKNIPLKLVIDMKKRGFKIKFQKEITFKFIFIIYLILNVIVLIASLFV